MADTFHNILGGLAELTNEQLALLDEIIGGRLDNTPYRNTPRRRKARQKANNELEEQKFALGYVCPKCGKRHIIKYGWNKTHTKRKYKCVDCGRCFTWTTNTIFENTKLSTKTWSSFAVCMAQGYSLRKCAKEVGVSLKTAFYMRHKLLSAMTTDIGIDHLRGIIEMDETFFAESFKGDHNRQYLEGRSAKPMWVAPRDSKKSRHRGQEVDYRGISHEQMCVSTALDRSNGMVLVSACCGRVSNRRLTEIYNGKVEKGSTICTDSNNAYKGFAKNMSADLIQIDRGQHMKGSYHINHINALHSKLKKWVRRFNGVATKYLENYLYWFHWEQLEGKDIMTEGIRQSLRVTHEDIRQTVPFK